MSDLFFGIPDNSVIYLDTSAVNFLCDNVSLRDAAATKLYHARKGTRFYISSTVIWEILATKNDEQRELLIAFMQNLCYEKLINSPSEFILNYIKAKCPLVETPYDFHSKLPIANVWTDVANDKNRTFSDYATEQMGDRSIVSIFREFIKDFNQNIILEKTKSSSFDWLVESDESDDVHTIRCKKLAWLMIIILLVAEMDFDPTPVKEFWCKLKMDSSLERLLYLKNNLSILATRGPFALMAKLAIHQIGKNGGINRGIILDMYHVINLTYCNVFFTNDEGFRKLKENFGHPLMDRIHIIKDYTISKHDLF